MWNRVLTGGGRETSKERPMPSIGKRKTDEDDDDDELSTGAV